MRKVSVASVCKNGIYVADKDENGEWQIVCLHDIHFTYNYDGYYFYSDSYEDSALPWEDANKTWWFTSFRKALNHIQEQEKKEKNNE